MKRISWFIGLVGLTAAIMVMIQGQPWYPAVYAQEPTPPAAVSEEGVPGAADEVAEDSPDAVEAIADDPAMPDSPEAIADDPPAADEATTAEDLPTAPAPGGQLPLADPGYSDPGQRFVVGQVADYRQTMLAGVPLFESADGNVAYTVALRPRAADDALGGGALAQIALDTFRSGEGLQVGAFEPVEDGGVRLPWTGTLTMGRNTQPMSGLILARQVPGRVLLLLIAATEAGADQVESVYATLEPTLMAPDA
jgi:hypothetical protein